MKKLSLILLVLSSVSVFCYSPLQAQSVYWIFLTDKQGTTFDPYSYFDAKAIERYNACGADLYDISNYPVNSSYEQGVSALATEEIGVSRWMNAMGVVATPAQIMQIESLPYVLRVQPVEADMQVASFPSDNDGLVDHATVEGPLEAQLVRMGGKAFRDKGIDGKGVRIAVFDGGFPRVNTHEVFRHLRDNKQIIKTWNFPNNRENVYGWNSHGTMTLSCIAGRYEGKDLGLATGAEFLLARTEIEAEPFKEEVWWQMAVEWADKNGANIISSSLGYGKERHYTKDMDGTSYVAKAGNLAARKGMLVVNSAGNEADDGQWRTIITPSDADSVLCIGGIENSLTEYNHITFSSYGPSADGRQKPNVCAFGYARTANITSDQATHYVHGTSFSCPLVAGFAACAWQASPGKTAMEMFRLIEQSADLYPYCDYSYGYGVPQASFFVGDRKAVDPTFRFVALEDSIRVEPTHPVKHGHLFYSFRRPADHRLAYYGKVDVDFMDVTEGMSFSKAAVFNRTLTVHLNGYTDSLRLPEEEYLKYNDAKGFLYSPVIDENAVVAESDGRKGEIKTRQWGSNASWRYDVYFQLGVPAKLEESELPMLVWSPSTRVGLRLMHAFNQSYCLGLGLEWGGIRHNYKGMQPNALEHGLGADAISRSMDREEYRRVSITELSLEFFQRIRLVPGGIAGKGFHWDLGVYGSYGIPSYTIKGDITSWDNADSYKATFGSPTALDAYRWNYGVTTRLTNDWFGVYARYRLNGLGQKLPESQVLLPRLEVGIQLCF